MATTLENQRAAYQNIWAEIARVSASLLPTYTLPNGVSVDRNEYLKTLMAQQAEMAKIPGVAPDAAPTFEIWG